MTFTLRPYQKTATDAAKDWLRTSAEPIIIDAAPAAGKSFMVADLAHWLHDISGGKRVLCLQPNRELTLQNFEKFSFTGERASIFSASAGTKSTRHFVVFATPKTVANSMSRFTRQGKDGYCAVIVDESHGVTPTIKAIIQAMREANPNLRVIGLTGTPFRLGTGYIFHMWPDGRVNDQDTCRDPYFLKCVYRVSAREMLDQGFITPMEIGEINASKYDTSGIVILPNGTLNTESVERAFEGHGRRTTAIVADVIAQANRRHAEYIERSGNVDEAPRGVMYFAATVRHAHEVIASLPPDNCALVTGDECFLRGKSASRKQVIDAYRKREVRHIVSVGTLTTGFDVEHTEIIALLRYTESAALLQQILGRAWRLCEGKLTSLLLDYAGNVEEHFPDGDIYNPRVKAKSASAGSPIDAECPDCGYINEFSLKADCADFQRDAFGYCVDTFGSRIETEFGPMAAHWGRRCVNMLPAGRGTYERCNYRWTGKECPNCGEINDIAARYCIECRGEIVNPNDKLISDFKALKRDPTIPQTDKVLSVEVKESTSRAGNATIRLDFVTPYRQFSVWLMVLPKNRKQQADLDRWESTGGEPETVSYVKDGDFYRILAFNRTPDDEKLPDAVANDVAKLRRYAA